MRLNQQKSLWSQASIQFFGGDERHALTLQISITPVARRLSGFRSMCFAKKPPSIITLLADDPVVAISTGNVHSTRTSEGTGRKWRRGSPTINDPAGRNNRWVPRHGL